MENRDLGTYVEFDGRPAVRFVRAYQHPIERVWSAVTNPDELRHWFPSNVAIELKAGGTITFSGDPYAEDTSGTVLTYDPPRRLAFTWADDEVRFELEPLGTSACQFTLTNILAERNTAARNASGWTVCLHELNKHLSDERTDGPHSANTLPFQPLYDAHIAAGLPSGAEIPSPA